jgi:hypothetical protein
MTEMHAAPDGTPRIFAPSPGAPINPARRESMPMAVVKSHSPDLFTFYH